MIAFRRYFKFLTATVILSLLIGFSPSVFAQIVPGQSEPIDPYKIGETGCHSFVESLANKAFTQVFLFEEVTSASHTLINVQANANLLRVKASYHFEVKRTTQSPSEFYTGIGEFEVIKNGPDQSDVLTVLTLDNTASYDCLSIDYSANYAKYGPDNGSVDEDLIIGFTKNGTSSTYSTVKTSVFDQDQETCTLQVNLDGDVTDINYVRTLDILSDDEALDTLVLDSTDSQGKQTHIDALSRILSGNDQATMEVISWAITENGYTTYLDPAVSQMQVAKVDDQGNYALDGYFRRMNATEGVLTQSFFNLPDDYLSMGRGFWSGLVKVVAAVVVTVVVAAVIANPVGAVVVAAGAALEAAGVAVSATAVVVAAEAVTLGVAAAAGYVVSEGIGALMESHQPQNNCMEPKNRNKPLTWRVKTFVEGINQGDAPYLASLVGFRQ